MESFLIKAFQLILSLSILVIVHEFGHFIFARIYKVRVEKFYLFFNPWFSLFKFKPKNSETEYGIGWLPLGGYVKIAGMIDESMDKEQMKQPVQEWEFRAKSAPKRLMIMIAGVLFNFLLALFIYSMISFKWGSSYIPLQEAKNGLYFCETAHQVGFQDGDLFVSIDGVPAEKYPEVTRQFIDADKEVTVLRDGQEVTIPIPEDFKLRLMSEENGFFDFIIPVVIDTVVANRPAQAAGLIVGDSIVSINGLPVQKFVDLSEILRNNSGKTVDFSFFRNDSLQTLPVSVDTAGLVGIGMRGADHYLPVKHVQYGFFESFPKGIKRGINMLSYYVGDTKMIFSKEGAKQIGGFGTIGSIFPDKWDWQRFWEMTAFLSIALAFMNILPIPALDGGHVLFLLYEVITRRTPNEKFMEYAQITGMALLFGLLLYANGNDLFRFLIK